MPDATPPSPTLPLQAAAPAPCGNIRVGVVREYGRAARLLGGIEAGVWGFGGGGYESPDGYPLPTRVPGVGNWRPDMGGGCE
jgi:hypothetical protein